MHIYVQDMTLLWLEGVHIVPISDDENKDDIRRTKHACIGSLLHSQQARDENSYS